MEEIYTFIQQRRMIGESDDEIATELIGAGWDRQSVSEALHQTKAPVVPSPGVAGSEGFSKKKIIIAGAVLASILILALLLLVLSGGSDDSSGSTVVDKSGVEATQGIEDRDIRREADIGLVFLESETFARLNEGSLVEPSEDGLAIISEKINNFKDPSSGDTYQFTSSDPEVGQIQYSQRLICSEGGVIQGSQRSFIVRTKLESGAFACIDNN